VPLWNAEPPGRAPRYAIRRSHPAVQAVKQALGERAEVLEGLLRVAELSVPVERIWLDVADEGGAAPMPVAPDDIDALARPLAALVAGMDAREDPEARLEMLLRPLNIDSPALRQAVLAIVRNT
jgi:hypothetical protein